MAALILRHRRAVYCIGTIVLIAGIVMDLYTAYQFGWIGHAHQAAQRITEDSPGWNCATMGNRICGAR